MFSFLRKKEEVLKIKDVVWLTEQAKFKSLANEVVKDPDLMIIAWFEQTYEKLGHYFTTSISLSLADQLNFYSIENKKIIFAEHYPLAKKENELFEQLRLKEVTVYSSFDEPLIYHFTGNRLQEFMVEQSAQSQADWLTKNLQI